jgi:hypothetical protein
MSDEAPKPPPRTSKRRAIQDVLEEAEAVRKAVADWKPPAIASSALFSDLSSIRLPSLALSSAFANPARSVLMVESLRRQSSWQQLIAPSVIGGRLALDAARPLSQSTLFPLGSIGQQVAVFNESLSRLAQRATESLRFSVANIVKQTQGFAEAWRPFIAGMATAVEQWTERQRDMDERTDVFVRRHGWPVPTSISSSAYHQIVSMADRRKREVTALLIDTFRPGTRGYYAVREVVDDSPHFQSRKPLLRQVWAAQRRGEWYLVINGLLPLVEGVLVDVMFPRVTRPIAGWGTSVERLRDGVEVSFGDAPVRAIETLLISGGAALAMFERYDPPIGVEPRSLNRHGILHGGARRYGTEQNAVKLFLLMALMAECFELYEESQEAIRQEKARKRERRRAASAGA